MADLVLAHELTGDGEGLIGADRPGGKLGRLIDGTGNILELVGTDVVVISPDDALGIDGNLEDVVRGRLVSFDKSEDT